MIQLNIRKILKYLFLILTIVMLVVTIVFFCQPLHFGVFRPVGDNRNHYNIKFVSKNNMYYIIENGVTTDMGFYFREADSDYIEIKSAKTGYSSGGAVINPYRYRNGGDFVNKTAITKSFIYPIITIISAVIAFSLVKYELKNRKKNGVIKMNKKTLKERLNNKTFKQAFTSGIIFIIAVVLIIAFVIQPIHLGTYYCNEYINGEYIKNAYDFRLVIKFNKKVVEKHIENGEIVENNCDYTVRKDYVTNEPVLYIEYEIGAGRIFYKQSNFFVKSGSMNYINYFALTRLIIYIIISVISFTILIFKLIKYRKSQLVFDTDKRTGNDLA